MEYFKKIKSSVSEVLRFDHHNKKSSLPSNTNRLTQPESDSISPSHTTGSSSENIENILSKMTYGNSVTLSSDEVNTMLKFLVGAITDEGDKKEDDFIENIKNRFGNQIPGKTSIIDSNNSFIDFLTSHYTRSTPVRSEQSPFRDSKSIRISSTNDDTLNIEGVSLWGDWTMNVAVLQDIYTWNFDIFELGSRTRYPLVALGETIFEKLHLFTNLRLSVQNLRRFLISIQDLYLDVPYHNYLHAVDVTQTVFYLGTIGNIFNICPISHLQTLAVIVSAIIHDVGHPGITGKFLISTLSPLALQYNDSSPLENMHLATAFTTWLKPENNFTKNIPRTSFLELRRMVIDLVLATDNDQHFHMTEKLETLVQAAYSPNSLLTSRLSLQNDSSKGVGIFNPGKSSKSSIPRQQFNRSTSAPTTPVIDRVDPAVEQALNSSQKYRRSSCPTFTSCSLSNDTRSPENRPKPTSISPSSGIAVQSPSPIRPTRPPLLQISSISALRTPRDPSISNTSSTTTSLFQLTSRFSPGSGTKQIQAGLTSRVASSNKHVTAPDSTFEVLQGSAVTARASSFATQPSTASSTPMSAVKAQKAVDFNLFPTHTLLVLKATLHAADVSNPAKSWNLYSKWTPRIMEEFYAEGDKQRELNLPITFAFDRYNPEPVHIFQLGFMRVIVYPLYLALSSLPGAQLDTSMKSLRSNIKRWEDISAKTSPVAASQKNNSKELTIAKAPTVTSTPSHYLDTEILQPTFQNELCSKTKVPSADFNQFDETQSVSQEQSKPNPTGGTTTSSFFNSLSHHHPKVPPRADESSASTAIQEASYCKTFVTGSYSIPGLLKTSGGNAPAFKSRITQPLPATLVDEPIGIDTNSNNISDDDCDFSTVMGMQPSSHSIKKTRRSIKLVVENFEFGIEGGDNIISAKSQNSEFIRAGEEAKDNSKEIN